MKAIEHFRFCPRCGVAQATAPVLPAFHCGPCGFIYYFNPAIAAAGFVQRGDGRFLFIRRAKEPAQGKLALPGGFIDAGETAEAALAREVLEEVNLELESITYLGAWPNQYFYREITYPVLDFFFVAQAKADREVAALDGVASYCWLGLAEVPADELAFPSVRLALDRLQAQVAEHR